MTLRSCYKILNLICSHADFTVFLLLTNIGAQVEKVSEMKTVNRDVVTLTQAAVQRCHSNAQCLLTALLVLLLVTGLCTEVT